ncbi:MAG: hypothetical protein GYA55_01680 [SAR324 cluster bacterium]|uniref:Inositol monophosphatase n=1 Tax=SAR324 cluster bacterium TaxID=2024889 RepID=A0A7X9IIA4_9DELT|nr:hypothetical protein [SAR324 cluster bacterium]
MDISSSLIETMLNAVEKAGELALTLRSKLTKADIERKDEGDWDLVTRSDRECQRLISEILGKVFPNIPIIGEEDSSHKFEHERFFTIDPIDGTWEYANRRNTWGVLIGYIENSEAMAGVMYQPELKNMAWSAKGLNTFLNANKVRFAQNLDRSVIISSGPWLYSNTLLITKIIPGLLEAGFKIIGLPCAISCSLAFLNYEGSAFLGGGKIWDVTPLAIATKEAGGVLASFSGTKPLFNKMELPLLFATNEEILKELAAVTSLY